MKASLLTCAAAAAFALAGVSAHAATFATQIDSGRLGGAGFDAVAPVKNTNRNDAGNALGAPDQVGNTEGGFYSLGDGGAAVFTFGAAFGAEATVFEVTFNCNGPQKSGGLCNFSETATVYAFNGDYNPFDTTFGEQDLIDLGFVVVGAIPNGIANAAGGATIAIGGPFTALALVDDGNGSGADGFDVDAISVQPVPVPPALQLLAGALIGLGLLSRRRPAS